MSPEYLLTIAKLLVSYVARINEIHFATEQLDPITNFSFVS